MDSGGRDYFAAVARYEDDDIVTSRERILAAIRFEKVDRIPVSPWGIGRRGINSSLCRELIRMTDLIIDVTSSGNPVLGKGASFDQHTECLVTTSIVHTPNGDLISRHKSAGDGDGGTDFFMKGPEDVVKVLSIPYEPPDVEMCEYEHWT